MFDSLGKVLRVIGIFLVMAGVVFTFWNKIPLLGKLPGDFFFQKGSVTFVFPLATSLVLSLVLTVILNIVFRLFK